MVTDQRPNGVTNYARIDGTPEVLAGILAVLGLAVLAQFAVASARRRRRDFAILRTLGLLRGQLTAITAWQVDAADRARPAGRPARWAWPPATGRGGSSQAVRPLDRCPHAGCRCCC